LINCIKNGFTEKDKKLEILYNKIDEIDNYKSFLNELDGIREE
jgi:hypothetical protein